RGAAALQLPPGVVEGGGVLPQAGDPLGEEGLEHLDAVPPALPPLEPAAEVGAGRVGRRRIERGRPRRRGRAGRQQEEEDRGAASPPPERFPSLYLAHASFAGFGFLPPESRHPRRNDADVCIG